MMLPCKQLHLTISETGGCRKTKLSEVIVTYMYNFNDATMQTITFVIILMKVNM